jgi:hypothetical protein
MALLWQCRGRDQHEACVSYDRLAAISGVSRTTVADAITRLRDLGVLAWRKTRLRIAWGAGIASRQWRNVYRWIAAPVTESATRTANKEQEKKKCIEQAVTQLVRSTSTLPNLLKARREMLAARWRATASTV